jgi:tetrapyrrole methylase family protein / MazG family protein
MPDNAARSFERLFEIIRRLRGPEGCPWDRAQTPQTLRASLVEEAWETVSAIDAHDDPNLKEELGDLYLLVTMVAWMKEQEGVLKVESVLSGIAEKLVRRHPHVFGAGKTQTADQALSRWDAIKAEEKGASGAPESALGSVSKSLPPLERSGELQKNAAKVGFDWPGPDPVWDKIDEELRELREAVNSGDGSRIEEEVGDLLFTVANLARLLKVAPGVALRGTNAKFERRFRELESRLAAEGVRLADAGLTRMDELWNQVKAEESRKLAPAEESRKFAPAEESRKLAPAEESGHSASK